MPQPHPPLRSIQTKLYRPPVAANLIKRPRLTNLLDRDLHLPLTLVSAPAGSGKTILLSDWLDECPCPSAWLSLDEGDSDLATFLSYFVAAIRSIVPDACRQSVAVLEQSELPPVQVLSGLLSNEIEALRHDGSLAPGEHIVLVLDDYHLIRGQAINDLLVELLRRPLPALRLVIATRSDPALPLANMRARGQVLDIRRQDLRFTSEETWAYLQQALPSPISEEAATSLAEATEGWIAGLHLVALTLRHTSDPTALLSDLSGANRYIMDYLADEVLSRQPADIQDFLLKTSILNRLSGSLCEAVTGPDDPAYDGQAYLERLQRDNLFIVALDQKRQWFRYHSLFQLFLRSRLEKQASPAEITNLQVRASTWFAESGRVEEAIHHALAAGDEALAVRIVETHRHATMNQERWQQLERWLRLFPRTLVDERPELLLLEAWILQRQWRFADLPPFLNRIESLLQSRPPPEPGATRLQAEVDTLRAMVSYFLLDGEQALLLARRALQTLPMEASSARGLAWMYHVGGLQARGDLSAAHNVVHEALKEDRLHGNSFPAHILIALCVLNWMSADLPDLSRVANHFLRLSTERNLAQSIAWAHYFEGCAAYHWNELARAESNFAAVMEQRYIAHSLPFSQSAYGLASTYLAQGNGEQARGVIESVLAYGMEMENTRVLADAQAFQAWLGLKLGHRAAAQHWADSVDRHVPLVPMTTFYVPMFSLAQILLDRRTPASLAEASELLAHLRAFVERFHNTRFKIETLALQALLDDARGHEAAALAALQQAIALAEPGGVLRAFVDMGPRMAHLLARLSGQGAASSFIAQILQAFPPSALGEPRPPHPTQASLVEPLTDRELEVLALLARRLSAKEIARRLVISDRTVKRHTANIYQKLGVHGRREAAAQAAALGLLPSESPPN